jgi:hypothetical protein
MPMLFIFLVSFLNQDVVGQDLPSFEEFKENLLTCSDQSFNASPSTTNYFMQTYENLEYDFSISYPSDWQLKENFCSANDDVDMPMGDEVITRPVSQNFGVVDLISTPTSREQGMVSINVASDPAIPLDEYIIFLKNQVEDTPGTSLSNIEQINFNGNPAYKMVFGMGENALDQIILDAHSDRFTIGSFVSPIVSTSVQEQIVNSFRILPK